MIVSVRAPIIPAATCRPSGDMNTLCTVPRVRIDFTTSPFSRSTTSTQLHPLDDRDVHLPPIVADRDVVRPSRERDPARDLHDVRRHDFERAVDLVAEVEGAPVRRRAATPCAFGIPSMICTTSFVTGSMMCTLSPAEFVWTMRTWPDWAAAGAAIANGNERARARRPGTTSL